MSFACFSEVVASEEKRPADSPGHWCLAVGTARRHEWLLLGADSRRTGGAMAGYIVAGVVVLFLVVIVAAAATGRARVQSCCGVADPAKDLRMRTAFIDDPHQH
jgi:hypothetical protein